MTAALERLEKESHRVAELLYQQAAPPPPASGARPAGEPKDGVIDAEFEEDQRKQAS